MLLITEFQVSSGNLLTTIDNWGPRFEISFQFQVRENNNGWSSILHFTSNDRPNGAKGSRIPAVMLSYMQLGKYTFYSTSKIHEFFLVYSLHNLVLLITKIHLMPNFTFIK